MPAAGETIIAGKVPGERIATIIRTANSANITTTETVVDTVVAPVVVGRTYAVIWDTRVSSTVAADDAILAIREDSVSGDTIQSVAQDIPIPGRMPRQQLYAQYSADVTEDKTFVATLIRIAGTGNISSPASGASPITLWVEYIQG